MSGADTDDFVVNLEGDALSLEAMVGMPIFEGCSEKLLAKNLGAVVRRVYEPGDIICSEGEFGSTAFYVEEGETEVFLASPIASLQGRAKKTGMFGFLSTFLQDLVRREPQAEDTRQIPIDASVDLSAANPIASLGAGELFGEMTCMSFYPRSATVRAKTRVVVLEMLRSILDILKRGSKTFKAQLEENYKERALAAHLKSLPLFHGITDDFIDGLRDRVELVSYTPGKVICKQGDEADRLYLIRIGFVKVSQESPGGEVVLKYLHRGDFFGEMGLLGAGQRTASCTALDNVELVEIGQDDFDLMIEKFPAIRERMAAQAAKHAAFSEKRMQQLSTIPVDEFLEQGLMEAQSLLLIDLDRCTRCDECVRACAASHDDVTRLIRDGLRYDRFLIPTSCRSCHDPLCMVGCPVGSIRRTGDLEIIIEDWCIGCGICAKNCPYGNINMHVYDEKAAPTKVAATKGKAITCDLCSGMSEPNCVYACPHEAAHRVDPMAFFGSSS